MKINIHQVRQNNQPTPDLVTLVQSDPSFVSIDLTMQWEDTVISSVWLKHSCHLAISDWIDRSLQSAPVHEVGGYLLGRYAILAEGEQFVISLEEFLPISIPNASGPTVFDFGGLASLKLDDAVNDTFVDLMTVGWLHTHPGHTPYLSKIDLTSVHEPHFPQPYHLAVVIDSLTEQWDTGFFSRKKNQDVNNYQPTTSWRSWKLLESGFQQNNI